MSNITRKLPKHDAKMIVNSILEMPIPKKLEVKMTRATPKLEPELNPKTYGPANGFRNKVCINKPEIDNPIPTKIAVIALGNLKLKMMYSQVSLLAVEPNKLLKTSFRGMATCPKEMFNKKANSNSNDNIEKRNVFRFLCIIKICITAKLKKNL